MHRLFKNFLILTARLGNVPLRDYEKNFIYCLFLLVNATAKDFANEIYAYKTPKQYNIIKKTVQTYTNKLMFGIHMAEENYFNPHFRTGSDAGYG